MTDAETTPESDADHADDDGPWVAASYRTGDSRRLHSDRGCMYLEQAETVRTARPDELDRLAECSGPKCGDSDEWGWGGDSRGHYQSLKQAAADRAGDTG